MMSHVNNVQFFWKTQAGRAAEAEKHLSRAVAIAEAELGADDVRVAVTLHELGVCVRQAGRPGEAEDFYRRSLAIKESELGDDDVQVAVTLHELGLCVLDAGRSAEADGFFIRALQIQEAERDRHSSFAKASTGLEE